MAFTLTMPEVGETVTEGTIERWLKKPGDRIEKYEPIVEINTDKVDVELPSPVSGTLTEILAPEGTVVAVHGSLASIETAEGEVPADVAPPMSGAAREPVTVGKVAPATTLPTAPPAAASRPARATSDGADGRQRATPRVRKLAAELSVDLAKVTGTGPDGRIVEDDVRVASGEGATTPAAVAAEPARTTHAPTAAPTAAPAADEESVPLTAIRRTIAQRMAASAFSAPHAWLARAADVTGLVALRQAKKEAFRERHGVDLTYLPFMAHAVSQSLPDHPYLNASWAEDHILLKKHIGLGIAVATERGLVVPVVQNADKLSIVGLATAMHDLGQRARDNKLKLEDVQGGTFTLDNTGAFGSALSMPIINHGQAAIISLEAIRKEPVVVGDDAIAVRSVVSICLSFDHRILDGHQAGAFLGDVKNRLEAFGPGTGLD